jgi:hypothetical protein
MPETQISELFDIRRRFLRSAHLERDFADPTALDGYVVTAQARACLERLAVGLRTTSGQRAWRITGDYGSGKSSFALLLAHVLGGQSRRVPARIRDLVSFQKLGAARPKLLPVLVTGRGEPIGVAILRALGRELKQACGRGRIPTVVDRIEREIKLFNKARIADENVVRLVLDANAYVVEAGRGSGMLLVLDELGKFLEFGALHPELTDVYLLQSLAEAASRSGKAPLFVVGLLHQGFQAYAEHLTQAGQREWEKVAGRFDELLFDRSLDETAGLIADALNLRVRRIPSEVRVRARKDMETVVDLGWYGAGAAGDLLIEIADRLYPLHPSSIPVLARLFSRFGQNERSLFSFLLSTEPFALQDFASRSVDVNHFYRIHNLYDYARANFGYRLAIQSFRSHWNHIESIIDSFPAEHQSEIHVLKTVGLLNVLDSSALMATEDALRICVGEGSGNGSVVHSTRKLKSRHVVYNRGIAGGLCLWPHTSANLERAYEDASKAVGQIPERVGPLVEPYLDLRPIVARRHYIETGNLRHFEVRFCPIGRVSKNHEIDYSSSDGLILVALCETVQERNEAIRIAESDQCDENNQGTLLYAIPHPLHALGKLLQEVRRWEWIRGNTPELNNDQFAAEEVTRQIANARTAVSERVRCFVGLREFGSGELVWYRRGKQIPLANGREFHAFLSTVCDEVYACAPRISNELVNRRSLSSAAAAARSRLIEEMFARPKEPYLGMDPNKKPPEMSIYLSLLKGSRVHRATGKVWEFVVPGRADDPCVIRPAMEKIHEILDRVTMAKVKVSEILGELRMPPFGMRDGLSPVLIAVFAVMNQHHVAFYQNGAFKREMRGLDLMMLTKMPETFEIQFCKLAGVRSELFDRLIQVLELKRDAEREPDVLDVVRPLCAFAAGLPPFTVNTTKLSKNACAVRDVLRDAREPARLLFRDLPEVLGFTQFVPGRRRSGPNTDKFVRVLKKSLDELRMNYPLLLDGIWKTAFETLEVAGSEQQNRASIAKRAESVMIGVTEPRLRAFCNRLADVKLGDAEWAESLGSLVTGVPPIRWSDPDLERYQLELDTLCARLQRAESLWFPVQSRKTNESALRVVITQRDGSEVDRVVTFEPGRDSSTVDIENQIMGILRDATADGLAAALRAFWKVLDRKETVNA